MRISPRLVTGVVCAALICASCLPAPLKRAASPPTSKPVPLALSEPSPTVPAPRSEGLWTDASVPSALRAAAQALGLSEAGNSGSAAAVLDLSPAAPGEPGVSTWVYALVAPFPTVADGVSSYELRSAWSGVPSPTFEGRPLLVDEPTLNAFSALWGPPAARAVKTLPAQDLLDTAWRDRTAWAI